MSCFAHPASARPLPTPPTPLCSLFSLSFPYSSLANFPPTLQGSLKPPKKLCLVAPSSVPSLGLPATPSVPASTVSVTDVTQSL